MRVDQRVVRKVLRRAGAPLGKSDIVQAARLAGMEIEAQWPALLSALKEASRIVQSGERRGAKYALATGEAS